MSLTTTLNSPQKPYLGWPKGTLSAHSQVWAQVLDQSGTEGNPKPKVSPHLLVLYSLPAGSCSRTFTLYSSPTY